MENQITIADIMEILNDHKKHLKSVSDAVDKIKAQIATIEGRLNNIDATINSIRTTR